MWGSVLIFGVVLNLSLFSIPAFSKTDDRFDGINPIPKMPVPAQASFESDADFEERCERYSKTHEKMFEEERKSRPAGGGTDDRFDGINRPPKKPIPLG